MIVVADTSPVNYLLQIGLIDLLQVIYGSVALPGAVADELRHERSPMVVREWTKALPAWITVHPLGNTSREFPNALGDGEREAIELAQLLHADLLLIDDEKGKRTAKQSGLRTTGTLGILLRAGERKLVDPVVSYKRLTAETNFHTSAAVEERFLQLAHDVLL